MSSVNMLNPAKIGSLQLCILPVWYPGLRQSKCECESHGLSFASALHFTDTPAPTQPPSEAELLKPPIAI